MTRASEPGDDEDEGAAELLDPELPRTSDDLPPIDFSTFIVSLRTSAMMHLGHAGSAGRGPNPAGSESEQVDLALARQEIDLLCILEDKTRGNLTGDEERLLSQILFDLRTRYVAACSRRS